MRISYQYTFTHSGLIVVVIAVLGCTPKGDLVESGQNPGPPILQPRGQTPPPPSLAITGPTGVEQPVDVEGENLAVAAKPLALLGNAPNPFNPATTLSFAVPESGGMVTLAILGVDGRRARLLVASVMPGGEHTVTWYGRDDSGRRLPSGVYFASLRSEGETQTRKLLMVQ